MCPSIEKCVHQKMFLVHTVRLGVRKRCIENKMNEHERDVHLNLVMKKVISLIATVSELQEKFQQLTASFQTFKEQFSVYDYIH